MKSKRHKVVFLGEHGTSDDWLTGYYDASVRRIRGSYVAMTRNWEAPFRGDAPAAHADLRDKLDSEYGRGRDGVAEWYLCSVR